MKKILLFALLLLLVLSPAFSYRIQYAEQFYKLYHQHFYQYPEDTAENLYYLGMALRSDFVNPLYALAEIENETEWEKYRYLFYMHINLKITDSYLHLASKYDKKKAYFYNAPWKEQNLESLVVAENYYTTARQFWADALIWAEKASDSRFRWLILEEIQFWEDERFRIESGELDYDEIIDKHLKRLESVKKDFEDMDDSTY